MSMTQSEDWIKYGHWDVRDDNWLPIQDLQTMLRVHPGKYPRESNKQYLTRYVKLPAWQAAPAKLKQEVADFLEPQEISKYDTSPLGEGKNWVTEVGGLPSFARAIAHALIRDGHSEQEAIQIAIGRIKDWAVGGTAYGGNSKVTPQTQAKAADALAEWEAKKAQSHKDEKE